MLKTLLASSSLSLVLLLMPIGTYGPVETFGIAGPSSALAQTSDLDIDFGDDDDDDCDDDDDNCDDDDD